MLSADKLIWPPTAVWCFLRNTGHSSISRQRSANIWFWHPALICNMTLRFSLRSRLKIGSNPARSRRNVPLAWQQVGGNVFLDNREKKDPFRELSKFHAKYSLMKSAKALPDHGALSRRSISQTCRYLQEMLIICQRRLVTPQINDTSNTHTQGVPLTVEFWIIW